jgi:(S)-2-hydroxy-acid oxidase
MASARRQKVGFIDGQFQLHQSSIIPNNLAAAAHGIIYILSTIATSSIEEIAEAAPNGTNWFQLYIYKDR